MEDTAFFRRIPERTIRMRPASKAECENAGGSVDGCLFVLSHRVTPDKQWRQFIRLRADTDYYLSEADARAWWNFCCHGTNDAEHAMAVVRNMTVGGKCICLHLVVGSGEGAYPNRKAATEALDGFAASISMPPPLIVGSGNGIGAVWPFIDVTPSAEVLYVEALRRLAEHLGLRIDGIAVNDMSRLLRGMVP